jgi:apolipoprotein N-acyltransferase
LAILQDVSFLNKLGILISGVLLALSFPMAVPGLPGYFLGGPLDLLAWVGLVPFLWVIRKWALQPSSLSRTFLWGGLAGTLFFLITVPWVVNTMVRYGGLPIVLSLLLLLLLAIYLGSFFGLFAMAWGFLNRKTSLPWVLTAPPVWVTMEWLRGHLLTGFPWADLGYSQYQRLPVIQIADFSSVYGVSFVLVAANAAIAEALLRFILSFREKGSARYFQIRRLVLAAGLGLGIVMATLAYGSLRLSMPTPPEAQARSPVQGIKIGVLQGNIPQHLKWEPSFQRRTMDVYTRLTREAVSRGAKIVIWPEAATPFFFQNHPEFRQKLSHLADEEQVYLLFGSPAYFLSANGPRPLNSAYLLSPEGKVLGRYDKMHLVPFGEYVPFSDILFFVSRMVEGIGDFSPGKEYTVMETPSGRLGVVICFEAIFPDLVRQFVDRGAGIMVTLTNDAWFGRSSAPYQHFSMVVFRAVENRVPFARAANTGISGFIDAQGRILRKGPLFQEAFLTETLSPGTVKTFYTRYGDLFAKLCMAWTAISLLWAALRKP